MCNQILIDHKLSNLRYIENIKYPYDNKNVEMGHIIGFIFNMDGDFNHIEVYEDGSFDSPHKKPISSLAQYNRPYKEIYRTEALAQAIRQIHLHSTYRGLLDKEYLVSF